MATSSPRRLPLGRALSLFARFYDLGLARSERAGLSARRAQLLSAARGDVLELGAGTGLNLPHYPMGQIGRLVLTEPDAAMRARLARKLRGSERVELSPADATRLPYSGERFDTVALTLVLCTIPDVAAALREVHRVLRPGGQLLFLEHVASQEVKVLRWQRRLEPLWRRFAGGCHLTRDPLPLLKEAGFELRELDNTPLPASPSFVRPALHGVALR